MVHRIIPDINHVSFLNLSLDIWNLIANYLSSLNEIPVSFFMVWGMGESGVRVYMLCEMYFVQHDEFAYAFVFVCVYVL